MLLVAAPLRKAGFALLVQKILQGCNNPTEGAFLGTVANSDVSRTMDSADPSSGFSPDSPDEMAFGQLRTLISIVVSNS
jgi:hypothetical protein